MEFLFQLIVELLVQLFAEIVVDAGSNLLKRPDHRIENPIYLSVGFLAWGLLAGAVSLWPFPRAFIISPDLRLLNLLITPLIVGGLMLAIGNAKEKRGYSRSKLERFGYAITFAFAMALVRLTFTK